MIIIRMLDRKREQHYFAKSALGKAGTTRERDDATTFKSAERAKAALLAYISPPAFWDSERAHRAAMQRRFKGWQFFYTEVT